MKRVIIGPPGTGKTTWLIQKAADAAEKFGHSKVLVASLTKAAATEAGARAVNVDRTWAKNQIKTLHAHAYAAIGHDQKVVSAKHIKAWNEENPALRLSGAPKDTDDFTVAATKASGDRLLEQYTLARARLILTESLPNRSVAHFAERWEAFKRENELIDFEDMIQLAYERTTAAPGNPRVIYLDEAQDHSAAEIRLAEHWGQAAGNLVVVGDPDQCHPRGTPILTTDGYVPIEELSENFRLLSFDRRGSNVLGARDGFPFKIASRNYTGEIYEVWAGGYGVEATANHNWVAKWQTPENRKKLFCVYLMQKGNKFRVGWCQVWTGHQKGFHLGVRARLEDADKAWILFTHDSKRDASGAESIIAANYGLPVAMFKEKPGDSEVYDQRTLDWIFSQIPNQEENAKRCLSDFGRDIHYPLWCKGLGEKFGKRSSLLVKTPNLIEGLTLVPIHQATRPGRKKVAWLPVREVRRRFATEKVWSLSVEPHKTYIANYVVVGNCLYDWRGADPGSFSKLISADRSNLRILEQSYRVPRQVHQRAVRVISGCIGRQKVEYRPRDATGAFQRSYATYRKPDQVVSLAEREAKAGRSVLILGTCSYHLSPTLAVLKKRGIPFHNPLRRKRGDWNPLAKVDRVHNYLRPQERFWGHNAGAWTWGQLWSWLELVPASFLQSGAKASVQRLAKDRDWKDRPMAASPTDALREVSEYFKAGGPQWYDPEDPLAFMRVCRAKDQRRMRYLLTVARRCDPDITTGKEEPRIVVGTVHSVKGGQADTVIFFPDLSKQAIDSGDRDAARRVYYVAYTRAREKLIICNWAWSRNQPAWTMNV